MKIATCKNVRDERSTPETFKQEVFRGKWLLGAGVENKGGHLHWITPDIIVSLAKAQSNCGLQSSLLISVVDKNVLHFPGKISKPRCIEILL